MYRKTILTTVTALLTIATGCPATAQQLTRVVSYRDLDLAGPAGPRPRRRDLRRLGVRDRDSAHHATRRA